MVRVITTTLYCCTGLTTKGTNYTKNVQTQDSDPPRFFRTIRVFCGYLRPHHRLPIRTTAAAEIQVTTRSVVDKLSSSAE